jgi:hypothetical protein
MVRGRRPVGIKLIEHVQGSAAAKLRLQRILETLTGQCTVGEACQLLGIAARRFHILRMQWLQQAVQDLELRPPGRPSHTTHAEDTRALALEAEVQRLRIDLHAARIREEIALAVPHLLQRSGKAKRAKAGMKRRRRSPIKNDDTSSAFSASPGPGIC